MDRNIGDQLNKAFEAYRQVSIEKDNAKKELQKMTEYYERYTQELQKQIEDQQRLISELEAKLSATRQSSEEMKCEPCNHLLEGGSTHRKTQYPVVTGMHHACYHCSNCKGKTAENMGTVAVAPNLPVNSSVDYQDMLEAFEAIQGKFRQIRSLTRRQKDHLKRFHGGHDSANGSSCEVSRSLTLDMNQHCANCKFLSMKGDGVEQVSSGEYCSMVLCSSLFQDQRFSMPIQCTDRNAEAERPFPLPLRPEVAIPHLPAPLAPRGASQEERDIEESLIKLSVKFPPPADSEYDFLNSAPERNTGLAKPMKQPLNSVPSTLTEEEAVDLPMPFVYPTSPSPSTSSSPSQESVRGPQQPIWSPGLCDAGDAGTALETPPSGSPDKCAFCHAVVPQDRMTIHLYSHFSPKNEADN